MTDKIKTGSKGENLAADYLEAQGFTVVRRNYRFRKTEIDLIVQRANWLIFVEVKTRSSSSFGEPEDFVDDFKMRNIYEAAEEYIFSTNWNGHIRFDIVSVKLGVTPEILHLEDAIN